MDHITHEAREQTLNGARAELATSLYRVRQFTSLPGFSDYLVGKDGRVFSLISGKFVRPWTHVSGHLYLDLRDDCGRSVRFQVHQLVLLAFVGSPEPGQECCHRDGDPENNSLSNLRWASRAENIEDYRRLHGCHWACQLTREQAENIRAEYTGKRGQQALLAAKYGVSRHVISDLVRGQTYKRVKP